MNSQKKYFSIVDTTNKLNQVSSSFCLAKWYRTTLRLDQGKSYSCHHCPPTAIDATKLVNDLKFLTNTQAVFESRNLMLLNKRPSECNYCWTAEDNGIVSDRITKSTNIINSSNDDNLIKNTASSLFSIPKFLEISFDNICNFKCSYCNPNYSSRWAEEISRHGTFNTTKKRSSFVIPIKNTQNNNIFVDSFMQWLPELITHLDTLRITGGEPLLHKQTYEIFKYAEDKNINLAINSNLGISKKLITKLINNLTCYKPKNFILYSSLESTEKKAEYSRFGLNFKLFDENLRYFLDSTNYTVNIMMTNNILSITDFSNFLNYIHDLKTVYKDQITFSATTLRYPEYLQMSLLSPEIKKEINSIVTNQVNTVLFNFSQQEVNNIFKILEFLKIKNENFIDLIDFKKFIIEYDSRRKTNFLETFPELNFFFNSININE